MRHRRSAITLAWCALAVLAALAAGPAAAAEPETIAELSVQPAAISPNLDGLGDTVAITYVSTVEQDVLVYVGDRLGAVVQTIASGVVPAGPVTVAWDGRGSDGAVVADGPYDVIVEAHHADGTRSIDRSPVVVDRVAPTAAIVETSVELIGPRATRFTLPLEVADAAHVEVAVTGPAGPATVAVDAAAGALELAVPIASRPALDQALQRGAARLQAVMTVSDAAGNRTTTTTRILLGSGTLDWPVRGTFSSPFGFRWGRMHEGVDLAAPFGRRIQAADGGVVVRAGWWGGYGNVVVVDHGTRTTLYGHQSRLAVRKGQVVTRGQTVGLVGSTGHSTGPHLHFEVRIAGELVDPLRFLPRRRAPAP